MENKEELKVVHLVTRQGGGAYIAAKRLNEALNSRISSSLVCGDWISVSWLRRRMNKYMRRIIGLWMKRNIKEDVSFTTDFLSIPIERLEEIKNADVIHLHWVTDGLISLTSLCRLCKLDKPIVWTLHDMHPFTGGCHYSGECKKYETSCGNCAQLNGKTDRDFSTYNQKKKKQALNNANISIVGCSRWITNCAKNSAIMSNHKCIVVPNPIDTETFSPLDKDKARKLLGIEFGNKKVVAFGAISAISDKRKGFAYLDKALSMLNPEEYACLIFGGEVDARNGLMVKCMGNVDDEMIIAQIYSAADVFVAPSLEENLANTVMESLSCGTPVVAFQIGGMSDMIEHEKNGYLVEEFDAKKLSEAIVMCCNHPEWGIYARQSVIEKYSYEKVSEKYINLYNEML